MLLRGDVPPPRPKGGEEVPPPPSPPILNPPPSLPYQLQLPSRTVHVIDIDIILEQTSSFIYMSV